MKIDDIKKTKYGYNVYSGELKVNIEISVFNEHKLKKDLVLTDKKWQEILKDNKREFIKRKSLLYLSRRRSTKEFISYLIKLGSEKELTKTLVKDYTNKGYLDDYLYAEAVIKKEKNRYGKNKIREILINKGINKEIIDSLLINHLDENLEEQIISACKNVKAKNYKDASNKLTRSFMNKGYELNEIKEYLHKHLDRNKFNEEETIKKEYLLALKRYQKKYEGAQLNLKIRLYLYNKGFNKTTIDKVMRE